MDYTSLESFKAYQNSKKNWTKKHWNYHFFNNKKIDWWMTHSEYDNNITEIILPDAVKSILKAQLITESEAETLFNMIKSSDKENLYLAIGIIIKHKKTLKGTFKKRNKNV